MKHYIIERIKTLYGKKWAIMDRQGNIIRININGGNMVKMCIYEDIKDAQEEKAQLEKLHIAGTKTTLEPEGIGDIA